MHFIVTGGAGFIGSHLIEHLLEESHSITVIDNLATGCQQNLPNHPGITFLCKDIKACQPTDFLQPVDGIAHLAATPSVGESWSNPLETHHNNLSAMISVLMLCKALKIPKLVFASSAAVYGNTKQLPVLENHPTQPISPYGLQKLVSEQYASLFAPQLGLACVALRMFNVFGPRQRPDSPYSGVISIFTNAMQQGLPITIYGDGTQTRDFVYVQDVAIAFTKALTTPLPAGSFLSCNVGTGKGTSLLQLVNVLKPHFPEWHSTIHFATPRLGDIQHSHADISRATTALGFIPQWSVASSMRQFVKSLAAV